MKCIIFEPNGKEASALAQSLRAAGHQVLAQTSSLNHLRHLCQAYGGRCVVLDPDELTSGVGCPLAAGACAPSLHQRMAAEAYSMRTPPQLWEAVLPLCVPSILRDQLLENAAAAFEHFMCGLPTGLTRLPDPWLTGLPNILKRLSQPYSCDCIPWFVAGVAAKHGILELELHQEEFLPPPPPSQRSPRIEIRKALNLALYPSLWRPLKRRHWSQLHRDQPEFCRNCSSNTPTMKRRGT